MMPINRHLSGLFLLIVSLSPAWAGRQEGGARGARGVNVDAMGGRPQAAPPRRPWSGKPFQLPQGDYGRPVQGGGRPPRPGPGLVPPQRPAGIQGYRPPPRPYPHGHYPYRPRPPRPWYGYPPPRWPVYGYGYGYGYGPAFSISYGYPWYGYGFPFGYGFGPTYGYGYAPLMGFGYGYGYGYGTPPVAPGPETYTEYPAAQAVTPAPVTAQPASTYPKVWHYCETSRRYYPEVRTCDSGWSEVPQVPDDMEAGYWYHCSAPKGYYPYVRHCERGWERRTPVKTP